MTDQGEQLQPLMRLRAYRVCLDPTPAQLQLLAQHAGAQRWAFNWALAAKVGAHKQLVSVRHELAVARGVDPEDKVALRALTKEVATLAPRIPSAIDNLAAWRKVRGDERIGEVGISPWWPTVSSYAISSGMRAADVAFTNWIDSLAGRRSGRRMGYPRFKRKGRARDSFTLFHDVKKPTIRAQDARHVVIPRIGAVRLHSNLRRLIRLQSRGGVTVRSITVAREGDRWFASLLVEEPAPQVRMSSRRLAAGVVGIDLGVSRLLTTSDGQEIANDRLGKQFADRLTRAQRAFSRTQRGSQRRQKAARRIGRLQARLGEQRTQRLHQVTKQLATSYAAVAIEDLNVAGMTASARGTIEQPGHQVRQKAGLNREILDVGFGEFRRQLTYKTGWYGSRIALVGRFEPTSKACSSCGAIDQALTLRQRTYQCRTCGHTQDRDLNAAINIAAFGTDLLNTETPNGARLTVAKSKPPRRTSVLTVLPDTRDERDSRGDKSGRPRTDLLARPAGRVDPGRPPAQARGHPGRVIRQRSNHLQKA